MKKNDKEYMRGYRDGLNQARMIAHKLVKKFARLQMAATKLIG